MYHNFANLFSKLSESTFYKKISTVSFNKKYRFKSSIRLVVLIGIRNSQTLLRTPVFSREKLSPRCIVFWGSVYPLTMLEPPGELMTREN